MSFQAQQYALRPLTSCRVGSSDRQPHSLAAAHWYPNEKRELLAAAWCITEFASALGIKQSTSAIDVEQARAAWMHFERLAAADLRLLPVEPTHFHRAAELVIDAASALRAGDALHLACAEAAGAKHVATLDDVMARGARRLKIRLVPLRGSS